MEKRYKILILTIDALLLIIFAFGIFQIVEKAGIPVILGYDGEAIVVTDVLEEEYLDYFFCGDKIISINKFSVIQLKMLNLF